MVNNRTKGRKATRNGETTKQTAIILQKPDRSRRLRAYTVPVQFLYSIVTVEGVRHDPTCHMAYEDNDNIYIWYRGGTWSRHRRR
jgi:hypothetical protein